MSTIKRSELPGRGARQEVADGAPVGLETEQAASASGTSEQQQQQRPAASGKLVFGLNARTNRVKHDEYAEQRLNAIAASAPTKAKLAQHSSNERARANGSSPASARASAKQAALSGRSVEVAPQMTISTGARVGGERKSAVTKVQEQPGQQVQTSAPATDLAESGQSARPEPSKSVRTRSRSPEKSSRTNGTGASSRSTVRRRSVEEKKAEQNSLKSERISKGEEQQQSSSADRTPVSGGGEQPTIIKARTQFNILPPPQLSVATTGRGSVVNYAKSRIYDKPKKQILSNPPYMAPSQTIEASSLVFAVGGDIPQSILCGRKPPKQVNVSKARKEWEGGEPFAKCRSRKRLAAAQRNKNKLMIHESWSMTSVVATQQLQLQQALAAASQTQRSNIHQSDPSVKVLTRGSVLERVQQFERAPSLSSTASSISNSSSSFQSSDDDDDDEADGDEATLTIDHGKSSAAATRDEPGSLSPGASKQAAYRHKVCSIQRKQKQQSNSDQRQAAGGHRSLVRSASSSGAGVSAEQRRLSLRRRSSVSRTSSASLIPKFYHPQGLKPNTYEIELEKRNIVACFDRLPERRAQLVGPSAKKHFHSLALACGFSEYYKIPLLLYVKHLLETEPSSFDEANLAAASGNGLHSLARRRSSLLMPLNPNNVSNVAGATSISAARQRTLTRSSSQQMSQQQVPASTKIPNSPLASTKTNPLQKSASIDSGKKQKENGEAKNEPIQYVSCEQFLVCWRRLITSAFDASAKFTHLLTLGQRDFLLPDDFVPLVQSVIDDHPGLKFLRVAPDFHMRYIQTVIARIYYCVNKSWTGKIKLQELRRSNFLAVLQVLSQEEDINQITDYFSYEHFYVIYCKFWSLDHDHDLLISKEDLARHNDASISSRIIERIFSGVVSRQIAQSGKMSYSDFVWFLISEEDKKHPRSIEYWFRLMDLDGDGYISMYELEYFYYEQMKRLELMNIEALPFLDTACQILDLVNPREKNKISLADLKRTKMATIFFDTFINLEKYLEHESREFVSTRDVVQDGIVISDWDKYASDEYENMVTEESSV